MIHFSVIESGQVNALIREELLASSWPWTTQNLKTSLEARADCRLISRARDTLGYYVVQRVLDEAELLNFVIFRKFQSQGLGRKVLIKLQADLTATGIKSLFLEVRASNVIAISLYEKTNFAHINTRKNYYRAESSGDVAEDAIVMRCRLP